MFGFLSGLVGPATASGAAADPEAIGRAVEAALPGFRAKAVLVGTDRRCALAIGREARVAVIRLAGRAPRICEMRWEDIHAVPGGIEVETRRRGFGTLHVNGIDVLDIRRAGGDEWKPAARG